MQTGWFYFCFLSACERLKSRLSYRKIHYKSFEGNKSFFLLPSQFNEKFSTFGIIDFSFVAMLSHATTIR